MSQDEEQSEESDQDFHFLTLTILLGFRESVSFDWNTFNGFRGRVGSCHLKVLRQ
jgi:hypothetical protein